VLEVRDLRVRYGAVEALGGVDLEVREGELVALIGSNGAGKSTCLRALAGIVRPVEGSIRLHGEEIRGEPAHRIVARGISLVPEGRRLFGDQTVLDNLLLGGYRRRVVEGALRQEAETYLDRFPVLRARRDLPAAALSGGEQQMLAISRGLMAGPRLLLLDEPSLGLAPLLVREIFGIIEALRREGRTILLVEQMANLALRIADRAYVLEHGRITLTGPAREVATHPAVVRAYLGSRAAATRAREQEGSP
jgi:branched-chain amino acid transport system ATP-binding protein